MTLSEQIEDVMQRGELTLSDVAVWLQVNRLTLRSWVVNKRTPRERRINHINARLTKLDELVTKDGPFVPADLSEHKRPAFIRGKADEICGGIPKNNTSFKRKVLRSNILQQ
jgi:hypothetical protein